jgi:hypothetical protein
VKWPLLRFFAACAVALAFLAPRASADILPPGQHSGTPKVWPRLGWHVTNFTPLQFDGPIIDLTAGTHGDVWFGAGSSLEHIDRQRNMSVAHMPYSDWMVSGISVVGDEVWFSAGQSGKLGILDDAGRVRFVQAVPRPFNPDLLDVVANQDGEAWFVDSGRSSIGYRSSSGRLVEKPFPHNVVPTHMRHCMGRLWATAGSLYSIDDDLRPRPISLGLAPEYSAQSLACDVFDRLWVFATDGEDGTLVRIDSRGGRKQTTISNARGGTIGADLTGGVWVVPATQLWPGLLLLHFGSELTMTRRYLQTEIDGGGSVVEDANDRLWLAMNDGNSPLAVTELDTR